MQVFKDGSFRRDLIAIFLIILVGVSISVLPHIISFISTGDPAWFGDYDDLLYLSYTANSYHNNPLNLSDPVLISGGATMYPWLQFIPPVLMTKLFGLSPFHINIIWRVWAGMVTALGLFCVLNIYIKNTWLAFFGAIILMTDIGMNAGTLFYKHWITATQLAIGNEGNIFQTFPILFPQWRIITPGVSLPFLLLHIWLLQRATFNHSRKNIILASLGLGFLFYTYFYFWTAALLAIAIAFIVDVNNRKIYLSVGILGTLLGLPQIIQNVLIKRATNNDWLPRSDNFLSIPHFTELLIPTIAISIICISAIWVFWKRNDLIYIWSLGLAGLLLTNHQIITGLQIQNFHWKYCWGTVISILTMIIVTDIVKLLPSHQKNISLFVIVLSVAYLTTGIWLRSLEAIKTKESVEITANYHKYQQQQVENPTIKLMPRAVIGGSEEFINFAIINENQRPVSGYSVLLSPAINNDEWDQRVTLNAFLLGKDSSIFIDNEKAGLLNSIWGPWARDPERLAERITNRKNYFDQITANPLIEIKKYKVRYVALPLDISKPSYVDNYFRLLEDGKSWQIWELM